MKRVAHFSAGFASLLVIAGCLRSSSELPPKPPESVVAQVACQAMRDYAAGLAESFDAATHQLESGAVTTAEEANAQLQAANAAARKRAFQPLDERLNEELGGERWDAQRAAQVFREVSAGLKTVAE